MILALRCFDWRLAHINVHFSEGTRTTTWCVGRRGEIWWEVDIEGGAAFSHGVDDEILVFARVCLSLRQNATFLSK